jgi:hypothetical protein
MSIVNTAILDKIKAIAYHYHTNLANPVISRVLSVHVPSDVGSHALLAIFTDEVAEYHLQGLYLDDLYVRLTAMAKLVEGFRTELLPNIRAAVYSDQPAGHAAPPDKALRDMAIANFSPNLRILADRLMELWELAKKYDEEEAGRKLPTYRRYPELERLAAALYG